MSADKRPAVPMDKQSAPPQAPLEKRLSDGPGAQPAVRASDADRDRIADILREALAEGRLESEEHAERIDGVYRAKTLPELEVLIRDLPAGQRQPRPAPRPGHQAPAGPARNVVAILGGADRKGNWRVGGAVNVVAVCGGVDLDLTQAVFDQREVTINVTAVCGGIDIKVPGNVTLRSGGTGILGAFDVQEQESSDPDAPVITVRGVAICGGVDAKGEPGRKVENLRGNG